MSALNNFIPYGRQTITESDIQSVVDVLRGDFITQGSTVSRFEALIAQKVDSKYAIAVNSATSALHIACLALGLGPGDIVWTSSTSFVASSNCALYCGASIDFVDINIKTGLIDINALQQKLQIAKSNNQLPKILIPVHLAGCSCDMEQISLLASEYKFSVIEDASHAIGGSYKTHPVGSCVYSDITVTSFHPVKIITTGEGGMATTNSEILYSKMTMLRSHGITKNRDEFYNPDPGPWYYEQHYLGYNYRLTDFQAALGISQLSRLDSIIYERHKQFNFYKNELSDLPFKFLEVPPDVVSALHLAIIVLDRGCISSHKLLFEFLRINQVGVQLHYYPIHLQPYYQNLGFTAGQFPKSELYSESAISLPIFPGLELSQQTYIAKLIKNFFSDD